MTQVFSTNQPMIGKCLKLSSTYLNDRKWKWRNAHSNLKLSLKYPHRIASIPLRGFYNSTKITNLERPRGDCNHRKNKKKQRKNTILALINSLKLSWIRISLKGWRKIKQNALIKNKA
jgi:hypothetical protein